MAKLLSARLGAPAYQGNDEIPVADDLIERSRLSVPWVAVTLGLGFYAAVLIAIKVDYGDHFGLVASHSNFWLGNLEAPAIIAYLLLAHRFIDHFGNRAMHAFRPLVSEGEASFRAFVARESWAEIRYQWVAMLVGAAAGAVLLNLWEWGFYKFVWNILVAKIMVLVLYGLIGSLVYVAVARYRLFTRLYNQPLNIDIFNLTALRPMARWGLGIALSMIGAITISMLLAGADRALSDPRALIVYAFGVGLAVFLFFASLFSTHLAMLHAKERELREVHANLSSMYGELKARTRSGTLQGAHELERAVSAWLAYEKRIQDVPEWPYTAATLRGLFASVLLPVLIAVTQQIILWR